MRLSASRRETCLALACLSIVSSREGSVANYRKQESLGSQVIDFPVPDFRILPQKGKFATEPKMRALKAMKTALVKLVEACAEDSPITDCPILESLEAEERG